MADPPRMLITGTGRCGTGYIAQVLRACGVNCGHEAWWNPFHPEDRIGGLDVDASWCALALGLGDYSGLVCAQVRHPLDVVSSLVKNPTTPGPYRRLQERLMPVTPPNDIEWAMVAVDTYMEAASRLSQHGGVDGAWRLDDVNLDLVRWLCNTLDIDVTPQRVEEVLAQVPRQYNWHGIGQRLDWDDLPAIPLRERLEHWAAAWGWT